jgi:hypothetical protein
MNSLSVLAAATDQRHMNSCCAQLILAAETECGAFMFAAKQLFGEAMALRAGYLWVEALEADSSFRCQNSGLRLVTILAAGRLADLMGSTRQTPDSTSGIPSKPSGCYPDLNSMSAACATAPFIPTTTAMRSQPIGTLWRPK